MEVLCRVIITTFPPWLARAQPEGNTRKLPTPSLHTEHGGCLGVLPPTTTPTYPLTLTFTNLDRKVKKACGLEERMGSS